MPTIKRQARRFVAPDLKKAAEQKGIYKITKDPKMSYTEKLSKLNTVKYTLMLSKTKLLEELGDSIESALSEKNAENRNKYNMVLKLEELINLEIKKLKKTK